jgi:hypothetical protein
MSQIKDVKKSDELKYGFGQNGNAIVTATYTAPTGYNVIAISFLEATTFTSLTPLSSEFITDPSQTFPAGLTIYGNFTAMEIATGSAIVYLG